MLDILVRNAHGNLSEKHKEYAAKKLGKLDRYFHKATKVELTHIEEKQGHHIEVTVFADGIVLRGEETDQEVHAAIDKVAQKLETRMRRLKSKLVKSHRKRGQDIPMGLEDLSSDESSTELPEDSHHLVENRSYSNKPMMMEEAVLQMELLDYDLFVFKNADTEQVEVLFKREKGGLGLISPE